MKIEQIFPPFLSIKWFPLKSAFDIFDCSSPSNYIVERGFQGIVILKQNTKIFVVLC